MLHLPCLLPVRARSQVLLMAPRESGADCQYVVLYAASRFPVTVGLMTYPPRA